MLQDIKTAPKDDIGWYIMARTTQGEWVLLIWSKLFTDKNGNVGAWVNAENYSEFLTDDEIEGWAYPEQMTVDLQGVDPTTVEGYQELALRVTQSDWYGNQTEFIQGVTHTYLRRIREGIDTTPVYLVSFIESEGGSVRI